MVCGAILLDLFFLFFLMIRRPPRSTPFPTRRSSDLGSRWPWHWSWSCTWSCTGPGTGPDRKSTRLNSSHLVISYAVFCLKKNKRFAAGHAEFADTERPRDARISQYFLVGKELALGQPLDVYFFFYATGTPGIPPFFPPKPPSD